MLCNMRVWCNKHLFEFGAKNAKVAFDMEQKPFTNLNFVVDCGKIFNIFAKLTVGVKTFFVLF